MQQDPTTKVGTAFRAGSIKHPGSGRGPDDAYLIRTELEGGMDLPPGILSLDPEASYDARSPGVAQHRGGEREEQTRERSLLPVCNRAHCALPSRCHFRDGQVLLLLALACSCLLLLALDLACSLSLPSHLDSSASPPSSFLASGVLVLAKNTPMFSLPRMRPGVKSSCKPCTNLSRSLRCRSHSQWAVVLISSHRTRLAGVPVH